MMDIDTADHVQHGPSGESWVVAYVRGDKLAWCGWPQGEAALSDCTLVKKASPNERDNLLREMASCGNDTLRDRCQADHGRELVRDGDGHRAPHAPGWQEQQPGIGSECGHVADADRVRELQPQGREPDQRGRTGDGGAEMRHADSTRLEEWQGQPSHARPELAAIERADWWQLEPDVGRVADGVAHRVDRLRALGNGQVPVCAATAWRMLTGGMSNTHNGPGELPASGVSARPGGLGHSLRSERMQACKH